MWRPETAMPTAAQTLALFAAGLDFAAIPREVAERAKDCIIDTVGVITFGLRFPWSGFVANYARRYGAGGPCSLLGVASARVHAPYAALANGAFAHAFEQDSVRDPGVGAHPGATLVPALLALGEETGVLTARRAAVNGVTPLRGETPAGRG
jgi:2-methylcitrate dehydratase PrpD